MIRIWWPKQLVVKDTSMDSGDGSIMSASRGMCSARESDNNNSNQKNKWLFHKRKLSHTNTHKHCNELRNVVIPSS